MSNPHNPHPGHRLRRPRPPRRRALEAPPARRILVTTRNPDKVRRPRRRSAVQGDFEDRAISPTPSPASTACRISTRRARPPGHRLAQHRTAIDAAVGRRRAPSLILAAQPGPLRRSISRPITTAPRRSPPGPTHHPAQPLRYAELGTCPARIATGELISAAGEARQLRHPRTAGAAAALAIDHHRSRPDISGPRRDHPGRAGAHHLGPAAARPPSVRRRPPARRHGRGPARGRRRSLVSFDVGIARRAC